MPVRMFWNSFVQLLRENSTRVCNLPLDADVILLDENNKTTIDDILDLFIFLYL